jgi:hypothetical protein
LLKLAGAWLVLLLALSAALPGPASAQGDRPGGALLLFHDHNQGGQTPASLPIGRSLETLSDEPTGAIRLDGDPLAGTDKPQELSWAVLARGTGGSVASGSATANAAGVASLAALVTQYKKNAQGDPYQYLMVVSGFHGLPSDAAATFNTDVAEPLGVADPGLSADQLTALSNNSAPFSIVGIPGGAPGAAWVDVGLLTADLPPTPPFVLPPAGDMTGNIQRDSSTDQYNFVSTRFVNFTTSLANPGDAANAMSVDGVTYPSDAVARNTSGFQVLILDSTTLHLLANQTLVTNGGTQSVTTLQQAFLDQLTADVALPGFEQHTAAKSPPLFFIQSFGHPTDSTPAFVSAADLIGRLGGSSVVFKGLNDTSTYSLVGGLTSGKFAQEASTVIGQAGPLAGILARVRNMTFQPLAAGPATGVNTDMVSVAYQDPRPFPAFTPAQVKAETWIGQQPTLGLCTASETACDIRPEYYERYSYTWSSKADKLNALAPPTNPQGFTVDDFNAVKAQLYKEFSAVGDVQDYFAKLQIPFEKASTQHADFHAIAQAVVDAVRPPPSDTTTPWVLGLISKIVLIGSFLPPPGNTLAAGISASFALLAYLSQPSGASNFPQQLQVKAEQLADTLQTRLNDVADSMINTAELFVSDWGKLQTFEARLADKNSGWILPDNPAPTVKKVTQAAGQLFAQSFVPLAYPQLMAAYGATTANEVACKSRSGEELLPWYPWQDMTMKAQLTAMEGFKDGQPYNLVYWFSRWPFAWDHDRGEGPNDAVADVLFNGPSDGGVGLNKTAFISEAVFGKRKLIFKQGDDCAWGGTPPKGLHAPAREAALP